MDDPSQRTTGQTPLPRWPKWLLPPQSLTQILPFPQGLLLALAAVVGIYAGLAAGLLSNFVALFQVLFFKGPPIGQGWFSRFVAEFGAARWHFEFLVVGCLAMLLGLVMPVLAKRFRIARVVEPRLIRDIAYLAGFGLWLYYPLLALATLNRSLRAGQSEFLSVLEDGHIALRVLVPALGGLAVGALVRRVTPESGGHGVAEVLEVLHVHDRRIPGKVAFWKSLAAGLTIGSGGSAGREGPVVQMGSAVGNEIGVRLGLPRRDTVLLIACGAGAGIAASFNAPIAGAMFALEIILRNFGVRSFSPIVVSAVTATITSRALIGAGGEIAHISYSVKSPVEVATYAALGALAAIVATVYVRTLHKGEEFFSGHGGSKLSKRVGALPFEFRVALGGLGVGLLGVVAPQVMGNGYQTMNAALAEQIAPLALLAILVVKIAASGLTLGSGAPGGSFFPAVFLGAMLGGAFGSAVHWLMPEHSASSGAYAAVGMAAVVGAATQAPLTAVIMLFELTGSYEIVLPLMIACSVALGGARALLGGSMYSLRLKARGIGVDSPSKRLLADVTAGQVMTREVQTVPECASYRHLLDLHQTSEHHSFPVVDGEGKLVGVLSLDDARSFLTDPGLEGLVVARDLCRDHPPTALEPDTLEAVLMKMTTQRADHLPVVAADDPRRIVGIVATMDIFNAYTGAIARQRQEAADGDGESMTQSGNWSIDSRP